MSFYSWLLLMVLAGLIQTTWLPFNGVLLIIFLVAFRVEDERLAILAFVAGFFLDLALGGRLGLSSLYFLALTFLIGRTREKAGRLSLMGLFLAAFGAELFFVRLVLGFWAIGKALVFGVVFSFLHRFLGLGSASRRIKLARKLLK